MATSKDNQKIKVIAIARQIADAQGYSEGDLVGSPIIIAALAKSLDEQDAVKILRSVGVEDIPGFLAIIPAAAEGNLPPLHPDKHLEKLIRPFLKGKMSAKEALKLLVAEKNLTDEARQFLKSPCAIKRVIEDKNAWVDTKRSLRDISAFYQKRHRLGCMYHRAAPNGGLSDFASGYSDEEFHKAVDEIYADEANSKKEIFGSLWFRRSPLAGLQQRYGEDIHLLIASMLAEMGLLSNGPLSIREISWIMDPKYFHQTLGAVKNRVRCLRTAGAVQLVPDGDEGVRLYHRVLVAEEIIDDFLRFLREADKMTDEEIADCLKRGL